MEKRRYYPSSHRLSVNILLNNITFFWLLLFSMHESLHVPVKLRCIYTTVFFTARCTIAQSAVSLLSQKRVKLYTDFKIIWLVHSQGLSEQKNPFKISEKRERGRIQWLPKFFWVSPIIWGTDKATNFKFCTHIHRIDPNKNRSKFREN